MNREKVISILEEFILKNEQDTLTCLDKYVKEQGISKLILNMSVINTDKILTKMYKTFKCYYKDKKLIPYHYNLKNKWVHYFHCIEFFKSPIIKKYFYDFIIKYHSEISFQNTIGAINLYPYLSNEFIIKLDKIVKLDWDFIIYYCKNVSEELIYDNLNKLYVPEYLVNKCLNKEISYEFFDKVDKKGYIDWDIISYGYYKICDCKYFIKRYEKKLNWEYMKSHYNLTDDDIEELKF